MTELVMRRVLFSLFVLLVVSMMIFAMMRLIPGSPAVAAYGADVTAEQVRQFEHDHGLDRPIIEQYAAWIVDIVVRGDFGKSFITDRAIYPEVARTFPVTFEIVAAGFLFSIGVAVPLGILSAVRNGGPIDHVARVFAVVGVSVPGFWLGIMLIVYGSVQLRLFPAGGIIPASQGFWLHLWSLCLPAVSLGIYYTAIISRMMRSTLLDAFGQDYVRTARAMGLSSRRVLVYALKNALIPVVSVSAMSIGFMFGWAIVIEQVFNISGLSRLLLSAIFQRDYNTVQAVVMIITSVFIVANVIADVLYGVLNPRIALVQR
jgi:peptide/nickel transport system permease protein